MPKEKIKSFHAHVNDLLEEVMRGVETQHQLDEDFWIAVRNRRHGTTYSINRGPHAEIEYGLNSSKKAAVIQEKRMERMSRRGLDGLVSNGIIVGTLNAAFTHISSSGIVLQEDIETMCANVRTALKGSDMNESEDDYKINLP